ncbi:MAG: nucleoid occlusion protein [Pseudomonadota bacterium]
MRDSLDPTASEIEAIAAEEGKTRKRPRPGERRLQIVHDFHGDAAILREALK